MNKIQWNIEVIAASHELTKQDFGPFNRLLCIIDSASLIKIIFKRLKLTSENLYCKELDLIFYL